MTIERHRRKTPMPLTTRSRGGSELLRRFGPKWVRFKSALTLAERAVLQSLLESMRSARRSWAPIVDFVVVYEVRGMLLLLLVLSVGLSFFFLPRVREKQARGV